VPLVPLGGQLIVGAGKRKEDIRRVAGVGNTMPKEEMRMKHHLKMSLSRNSWRRVEQHTAGLKSTGFKSDCHASS
jgi:hypothetical protein